VLIKVATLRAIAQGDVDLVFRRWASPRATVGRRIRTAVGELSVEAIDKVRQSDITDAEAIRAGMTDKKAVLASLRGRQGSTYRVKLRFAGADRRDALREQADLDAAARAELETKLKRMDSRADKAWTKRVLAAIEQQPETRAADLAAALDMPRDVFKRRVRKLKELGLSQSLEVGYALSPRGRALVDGGFRE